MFLATLSPVSVDMRQQCGTLAFMDNRDAWRKRFLFLKEQGVWVRYPWKLWFDGSERVLEQGLDYDLTPKSFQTKCLLAARRQGVRVETHRGPDRVMIRKVADERV